MSLKRLFLSFFLVLILPIGNVWAARGFKRPGSPLHNQRHTKYRRQNPARQEWRPRDDQRREDRYQRQDHRPWLDWRDEDRPVQRFAPPPRGRSRQDDRDTYHKRDRARDDRGDHRPHDRRPSEDRGRSYRLQRDEQRRHNAYPRQARRWEDRPPTHWQQEHYQGHHQGRRHNRPYTQRRDDRGYYAQRPPQASGYDAPRSHKKTMSFNSLFKQIEDDLRRHNPRLEKHLDDLCEASYQRDFNFISVARAFNMLGRFAKNDHKRLQAIKAHKSFVPRMMQVAQQQMQGNLCSARGFANLLYGCMNLGITPDEAWQTIFWQHSQDKLNDFKPQEFSNTLYAAAKLSLKAPIDWKNPFWPMSQHKLRLFKAQEFSNMLYAIAKLGWQPPVGWIEDFWQKSRKKLFCFKVQEFSNILYGASKLGLQPPTGWMEDFWQESRKKLHRFDAQHCSSTLHSAAILIMPPPKDWLEQLWTEIHRTMHHFKAQELSNALYAACVLNAQVPGDLANSFASTLQSIMDQQMMQMMHFNALYNASNYLETQGVHLTFLPDLLAQLQQGDNHTASRFQQKTGVALSKVLKEMRPHILLKEEQFVAATASSVDFFIDACGEKGLVIQVDGPSHFLNKGTRRQCVDGFTAFQTRRLQDKGYQVLRLPYDLLNRHGVDDIENANSTVPKALAAYLKEQLTPLSFPCHLNLKGFIAQLAPSQ